MSELATFFKEETIKLIDDDDDFFDFSDSESLMTHLGYSSNPRQSLAIKVGKKIELAASMVVDRYAKKHSISIETGPTNILNKGKSVQIDFSRFNKQLNLMFISEIRTNPNNDTGKQKGNSFQLQSLCEEFKNLNANFKLIYATLPYLPSSEQLQKANKLKQNLKKQGTDIEIMFINELITSTLGISSSDFSEVDFENALRNIGDFLRDNCDIM